MQRGDAADNRQTQTTAGDALTWRAIESFADTRQHRRRNAGAIIPDGKIPGIQRHVHHAALWAVANGVIQQIAHQQAEQQRLARARDVVA